MENEPVGPSSTDTAAQLFANDRHVVKDSLVDLVTLPYSISHDLNLNNDIKRKPVSDATMLTCGCIISQKFALTLKAESHSFENFTCPVCHSTTKILKEVKPLRDLFNLLNLHDDEEDVDYDEEIGTKKQSLMTLFYSVANSMKEENIGQEEEQRMISIIDKRSIDSASSASNKTMPVIDQSSMKSSTQTSQSLQKFQSQLSKASIPEPPLDSTQEHREYLFVKCFPTYRRHYQHQTHSKILKTKSRTFLNTAISPNCQYFALLSPRKWEVFKMPSKDDFKDGPKLFCVGNHKGEFGPNFQQLMGGIEGIRGGKFSSENDPSGTILKSEISNWEHLYCAISNSLLVVSGTSGIFRVFDLNEGGKPIYIYGSNFPIRCLAISPNSTMIAYGITGKDRITGSEQALISMHKLTFKPSTILSLEFENLGKLTNVDPITITFPYHDPINHLSFSMDSTYFSCSTALESRFLTVLVKDINKPKLVMKSMRTLDTSLESEGITNFKMFPNNKFMIVTSVAFNAPPIIIDNQIKLDHGSSYQSVAQPKLLLRLDEVGNNIHKAAISPRNDSVALLDRNGTVYLMFATKMDQDSKRLVIVDQVSNSFRARESASLCFSADGHQLFIVDRKGILYINDFSAGLPQNPEITRCKPVVYE